jgi:N-acyl-phosphatidylethanolamine-hydrolysing phospholipase D
MRLGKKLIATDPIWSAKIAGAVSRNAAAGIAFEQMPKLDIVTVSHSHRDHLDLPSLKKIGNDALFIVPKDVGEILKDAGLEKVVELGWWETHREGDVSITLVPAQHWSMRTPFDRNKRLWGGFIFESSEGTAYHAGDTAFSEMVFTAIFEHFPKIDWAMLPIGAYDPQWFMQPQHMGPEEAVRAFEILRAQNLVAMHWGTFKLTDEPLDEPPVRARAAFEKSKTDPNRLWIFDIGETRSLK